MVGLVMAKSYKQEKVDRPMDVWQCLKILRKAENTGFFRQEKNQEEKLMALNRLSEIGYPSLISDLIPLLKSRSQEIRLEAIQTVQVLFNKLEWKNAYYDTLKHCPIVEDDLVYFERTFFGDHFCLIMVISSLNKSGYVREKAVRKLGELPTENVLPFIIFRLADWVPKVRTVAKEALLNFVKPEHHQKLINNLSLFQWLQIVERIELTAIYDEVIDFLVTDNREETLKSFHKIKDKERRILAAALSKGIRSKEEIDLFINDKHFLIRLMALDHFDRLTDRQKQSLLHDSSARVRQSTLYQYQGTESFEALLKNYLADKSGGIRHLSRFYLKNKELDFRAFYIDNLARKRQVIGSMLGLLDLQAKDCETYIRPYLNHEKTRVVKTAFYTLSKLNPGQVFEFAKSNLFTNKIGLRNLIIEYFGRHRDEQIMNLVRDKYPLANQEIKLSILKLHSRIGGYASLPDLLLGTIDPSQQVRKQAQLYIQKWKNEAVSMFRKPSDAERERVIKVFNFVKEIHHEHGRFSNNPVKGLDFYFR